MKIADRHIISSVLRIAIFTLAICTLMIVAVELFSRMSEIVSNSVSQTDLLRLSILGVPQYMMMVASVSFLFAVTFTLSQLVANNELIMLFNSGFSYLRVLRPIIILAVIVTILFTIFSQTVTIKASLAYDALSDELFGRSSTQDNTNITLTDIEGNQLIHASRYDDTSERLYTVLIIETEEGKVRQRISAEWGEYNEEAGCWIFHNASVFDIRESVVSSTVYSSYEASNVTLAPRLFRNNSGSIATMDHADAIAYLERIKVLDREAWQTSFTEYLERVTGALPILILILISCSMNYRFKKNVFLFSVIQSLCTAVVYYVVQMVTVIMAEQGIIHPVLSVVLPIVLTALLALLIRLLGLRNG